MSRWISAVDHRSPLPDRAWTLPGNVLQSLHFASLSHKVIKEGDVFTNKIIATGLTDHADAYAADCKM